MNYINDDYFLGHLLKQARQTNLNKLEVDIMTNTAAPNELLTNQLRGSIDRWCKWFPDLVKSSGSAMDYVCKATMTIEFDLDTTKPSFPTYLIENPFTCEVKIIDDRGKEYNFIHSGWWYPET
jgi:hypothetical protein